MTLKYLVVGTGRCGTGYISKSFDKIGIPCGHEEIFSLTRVKRIDNLRVKENLNKSKKEAESSWLAVPWLDNYVIIPEDCKIIHITRHPKDTIESLLDTGMLSRYDNKYTQFAFRNMPRMRPEYDPIINCAIWYVWWNRKIENTTRNVIRHKVEDDITNLFDRIGLPHNNKLFNNTKYNSRVSKKRRQVDLKEELSGKPILKYLLSMASEYGYEM